MWTMILVKEMAVWWKGHVSWPYKHCWSGRIVGCHFLDEVAVWNCWDLLWKRLLLLLNYLQKGLNNVRDHCIEDKHCARDTQRTIPLDFTTILQTLPQNISPAFDGTSQDRRRKKWFFTAQCFEIIFWVVVEPWKRSIIQDYMNLWDFWAASDVNMRP